MHNTFSAESYWHHTLNQSPLEPASLPQAVDVAVIGGGLLGTATSYWLARDGATVTLIEQGTLAAGATGRNGGLMVAGTAMAYADAIATFGHATARAVWTLTLENRQLLRQVFADEAIDCGYREVGHLHLALDAEQLAAMRQRAALLHADGFAADVLDHATTQQQINTPLAEQITGGMWTSENGVLHSARLVHGLARAAQRHGAQICTNTAALNITPHGNDLQIATTRGTVQARAVIIAVNAWTDQLVPELANVITPVRGQVLAYTPFERVFSCGMSAALTPTEEYWQQTADGSIVLGGCRAAAADGEVGVRELHANDAVQAALDQVLPTLFPALSTLQVARRWAGPMAFTADHMPIVDAVPGVPNAWFVGGFSGHGMPFGLRFGQLLAQTPINASLPTAFAPFRRDRPTLALRG